MRTCGGFHVVYLLLIFQNSLAWRTLLLSWLHCSLSLKFSDWSSTTWLLLISVSQPANFRKSLLKEKHEGIYVFLIHLVVKHCKIKACHKIFSWNWPYVFFSWRILYREWKMQEFRFNVMRTYFCFCFSAYNFVKNL